MPEAFMIVRLRDRLPAPATTTPFTSTYPPCCTGVASRPTGGAGSTSPPWRRHGARLIGPAEDPGTFFVKTVKKTSASAAYDQTTFYEAWRLTIQRYGIFNPYTGRGAVEGLLPHGPHNVRDVLATHILKQAGSYKQASYAIQDTPEVVAKHYGRFLPQDKAAIAAKILNQVWAAA